jgi:SPP1 gp7 family putative phage head morphogenesis protein
MIETCENNILVYSRYDPTHTTTLRNAFAKDMRRRFMEIMKIIKIAIVDKDCFGLQGKISFFQATPPGEGAFAFTRSSRKIEEFMKWLEEQVEKGLVTIAEAIQVGEAVEAIWTNLYIWDSYKRGVMRARTEMIKAGMVVPSVEASGGIDIIMGTPFHMDRVGVLFTRVYKDLKGITEQMDSQISRVLAQGMIDGDGARLIARKLMAVIDGDGAERLGIYDTLGRFIPAMRRAEMLARTEIIRAYHLATIQEYRNWGVLGIKVQGEWKTAGDDRVCDECASMEGKVFTLDEIEPMIPAHPMCRCIALPYVEELQKYR